MFHWFTTLPPYVQAMWFGVFLLFVLWFIPFFTRRFNDLDGEATNTRTVLLFMIVIPMTVYVTNQELIQKRGHGLHSSSSSSSSTNVTELPTSMFQSALKPTKKKI